MSANAFQNRLRALLCEGRTIIGSEISRLRSAEIPRIYARAGFDFVFIDMEHTAFSLETVADMIQVARSAGIVPLVRVPQAEYAFVARVLDAGAGGIIVPRVNTPQQAADIVSWMRYPPQGIRGFACTPAQSDGHSLTPAEFVEIVHAQTLCVIQIERRQAIENLDAMLAVPGVDVACLGYMDLSVDLGVPGKLDHPEMRACIERLIAAATRHGVASGIICPHVDAVADWVSRGMRFVSYSNDSLLLEEAACAAAAQLRALTHNSRLQ